MPEPLGLECFPSDLFLARFYVGCCGCVCWYGMHCMTSINFPIKDPVICSLCEFALLVLIKTEA